MPLLIFTAEWQALNGPPVGRADDMSIGYDPTIPSWVIYTADMTHKLYRSANEGECWDSIVSHQYVTKPSCVITDKNNAQMVYVGEIPSFPNNHCVWKSENGGLSWSYKDQGITNTSPLCFAMDPNNADIIYLGCAAGPCAVFKTSDGGEQWYEKEIASAETDPKVNDLTLAADPMRGTTILAACADGIYRSTDGGNSWVSTQSGVFHAVEFVSSYLDDYAYTGGQNGVYKTTNGGEDWIHLNASYGHTRTIAVIDANTVFSGSYCPTGTQWHGVYKTTDGGITWQACNGAGEDKIFCQLINKILVHPLDNSKLFVGTDIAVYKTTDCGAQWSEITRGYKLMKAQALDVSNAYAYTLGASAGIEHLYIFRSTNHGYTWKCVDDTCPEWHVNASRWPYTISVASDNPSFALLGFDHWGGAAECGNGGSIYKTSDGGLNWTLVYYSANPGPRLDPVYSVLINPLNNQYTYAGYCDCEDQVGFMRSSEYGDTNSWYPASNGLGTNTVYSIAVNPQDWDMLYAGTASDGVYKTLDNADTWEQTNLTNVDVNALAIDVDDPDIVYAGSAEPHGVYKTTNGGNSWVKVNNGLGEYLYIRDLALDPEEPTIVYALCQVAANTDESFVFCTVDRGGNWFDVSSGLPADSLTYDLEMDYSVADPVFAATGKGIYAYTPDYNKSLVSSSEAATGYNNGRKLVRIEGTDEFWICYESGGVVYALQSTDAGQTYSKKMEIGQGYSPVISVKPGPGGSPRPGIVWWAKGDRDTLFFARYVSGNEWTTPCALVTSDAGFGPPALAMDTDDTGHLVYAGNNTICYIQFDVFDPLPGTAESVGPGTDPSIGLMKPSANPLVHVTWEHEATVLYRSRTGSGTWSVVDTVFTNAVHPALEVAGYCVYVVWETAGDIFWRYTYYQEGEHAWSRYQRVCTTTGHSAYPVLSGGYACAWVEGIGNNPEIYFSYNDPATGWTAPINISNTGANSQYPHLTHKQTVAHTTYYITWTERDAAPHDIKFQVYSDNEQRLAFYMAECGQEEPSPFNLQRDGFIQYGSEPYKQVDFDAQYLEYEFAGLDPEKEYGFEAYVYQQGSSNLAMTVKVDNVQVGGIVLPPDTLIVYKHMIPANWYGDSTIDLKIFGNTAVSAVLVINEYEEELGGGGPQSAGVSALGSGSLMLNVMPNPAYTAISISYALGSGTFVDLSLYDVAGRRIKEFVNSFQYTGDYCMVFDLGDLAQGVYFIQLDTRNVQETRKVVLLK